MEIDIPLHCSGSDDYEKIVSAGVDLKTVSYMEAIDLRRRIKRYSELNRRGADERDPHEKKRIEEYFQALFERTKDAHRKLLFFEEKRQKEALEREERAKKKKDEIAEKEAIEREHELNLKRLELEIEDKKLARIERMLKLAKESGLDADSLKKLMGD